MHELLVCTSLHLAIYPPSGDLVLCLEEGPWPSVGAMREKSIVETVATVLRRRLAVAMTVAAVVSSLSGLPAVADVSASCRVVNKASGGPAVTDLQWALDRASPGDRIRVAGVCRGNFLVERAVTLLGRTSEARPRAVLAATRERPVVRISGDSSTRVRLDTLVVRGGLAQRGGGVRIRSGATLRLTGHARIAHNSAGEGGGVFGGHLTLSDRAAIVRNSASTSGGGVARSLTVIRGSARITDNVATSGGGIYSGRRVTVTEQGAVVGNRARSGGGVFADGPLGVQDRASISGNTARESGGGIYARFTLRVGESAVVSHNSAVYGGGVYAYEAQIEMTDDAAISANSATEAGGLLNGTGSVLSLFDRASITSNTAEIFGGIENLGSVVIDPAWTGTVCGNLPDDWPPCS